jgi:hypothetical protein
MWLIPGQIGMMRTSISKTQLTNSSTNKEKEECNYLLKDSNFGATL